MSMPTKQFKQGIIRLTRVLCAYGPCDQRFADICDKNPIADQLIKRQLTQEEQKFLDAVKLRYNMDYMLRQDTERRRVAALIAAGKGPKFKGQYVKRPFYRDAL